MPVSHRDADALVPARMAILKHIDRGMRTSEDVDTGILLCCGFEYKMVPPLETSVMVAQATQLPRDPVILRYITVGNAMLCPQKLAHRGSQQHHL